MMRQTLAFAVVLSPALAQTTVVIPCDRDNVLIEDPAGALRAAASLGVHVGVTGQLNNRRRRGILHFDVAAIVPAGARVTSAVLTLTTSQSSLGSPPVTVSGHRVLQDWGEGSTVPVGGLGGGGAGGASTANSVTWVHTFFSGSTWTNVGGDFVAAPSLSLVAPSTFGSVSSSVTSAVLADVQGWLDSPTQNFGWLLKTDEVGASQARRFDSRENTAGSPPVLTVTYITPGQTTVWGTGCPVGAGTFSLSWVGAAVGGSPIQLVPVSGPPNALAANLLSLSYDPVGFPLLPQCDLYLPLSLIVNQSIFSLDASGSGSTTINMPPGFPGVMFTSQTAALHNSPSGYVLSNVAIAVLQ